MFLFQKLYKDNYIKREEFCKAINISIPAYKARINGRNDFTLNELEDIKAYFVKKGIVKENFDIGDLLNEV